MANTGEVLLSFHFPYCVQKQKNGEYIVLNRKYKPVGFVMKPKDEIKCSDYPVSIKLSLTKKIISSLSWNGSEDNENIFLYHESCHPAYDKKGMDMYLKRLQILANIKQKK